ncbi:hypothetical protein [Pelomonas sp. KK5]|uniref:hypothetical protein n=1 Tax=Pelomonas sp. KK5 TaxID=1855730 RepID=UPI00117FF2B1|nr:hypothetical protein [Pelomonas sp. KK5]
MNRLTTSRPDQTATATGRWGRPGSARSFARHEQMPALLQPASLPADRRQALRAWLAGSAALRPEVARQLLEQAVDRRLFVDEPALHWRAVKALIAGVSNWAQMGFQLTLD